jgi:aldose 1-epimerase
VAIDAEQIPTGQLLDVGGTPFDFRVPKQLGPAMAKIPGTGIDHNFCLTQGTEQDLTFCSRVVHPGSGRFMEVYTDQPSVLFYTSNNLPDPCGKVWKFKYDKLRSDR